MSGTVTVFNFTVISGTLVLIVDNDRDWCAGCLTLENTGENLGSVALISLRCKFTLARFPSVELFLYIFFT